MGGIRERIEAELAERCIDIAYAGRSDPSIPDEEANYTYLATEQRTHLGPVTLKIIPRERYRYSAIDAFTEAMGTWNIAHEAIPRIIGFFPLLDEEYLAVASPQDVYWRTTSRKTPEGETEILPLTEDAIITIGVTLGRGLRCFHEAKGMIHGDVKRSNIKVRPYLNEGSGKHARKRYFRFDELLPPSTFLEADKASFVADFETMQRIGDPFVAYTPGIRPPVGGQIICTPGLDYYLLADALEQLADANGLLRSHHTTSGLDALARIKHRYLRGQGR